MRLNNEDYREAEGCLIYYNYNCAAILSVENNMSYLKATRYDGMPKAPYNISNPVERLVIQKEDNEEYKRALKKYKAVEMAKLRMNDECLNIFELFYRKKKNKWRVMYELGLSERTFLRRKRDLIYMVYEELKKMA